MNRKLIPLTAFGINAPQAFINGFEPGHEYQADVPESNPNYVFDIDLFREIHVWLDSSKGEGFYLSGPTGSGKTSFIMEMAARLNWPVVRVMSPKIREFQELEGQLRLKGDGLGGTLMDYTFGPLAKAMQIGAIFVLDEMDHLPDYVAMALNEVLEGNALTLFGKEIEVIKPHPSFRFFATGNTLGQGDDTGLMRGATQQNLAFLDRFWFSELGYPKFEVESKILENAHPEIPEPQRTAMINVANAIRDQFIGTGNEGASLTVTLSTRTIIRWGGLVKSFRKRPKPMRHAFEVAFLRRAAPIQRQAINEIARGIFGEDVWGE